MAKKLTAEEEMLSQQMTPGSYPADSVKNSMQMMDRVTVGCPEEDATAAAAGVSGSAQGLEKTGHQEMRKSNGGRRTGDMVSVRRSASHSDQLPLADGQMQGPAAAGALWATEGPICSSLPEEQNADQERSRSPRAKSDVVAQYTEDSRYRYLNHQMHMH